MTNNINTSWKVWNPTNREILKVQSTVIVKVLLCMSLCLVDNIITYKRFEK